MRRMYAIVFKLNPNFLEEYKIVHNSIQSLMEKLDFRCVIDGLYFGGESVNAVNCVLAMQELQKQYPSLKSSVKDIRMLRIEEDSDLLRAISDTHSIKIGDRVSLSPELTHFSDWVEGKVTGVENNQFLRCLVITAELDDGNVFFGREELFDLVSANG